MNFSTINKLLVFAALLQCAAACSTKTAAPFSTDFLSHLRANAPAPLKECIVARTLARWPDHQALYAEANGRRTVRGETDVVNFAIRQVSASCGAV